MFISAGKERMLDILTYRSMGRNVWSNFGTAVFGMYSLALFYTLEVPA